MMHTAAAVAQATGHDERWATRTIPSSVSPGYWACSNLMQIGRLRQAKPSIGKQALRLSPRRSTMTSTGPAGRLTGPVRHAVGNYLIAPWKLRECRHPHIEQLRHEHAVTGDQRLGLRPLTGSCQSPVETARRTRTAACRAQPRACHRTLYVPPTAPGRPRAGPNRETRRRTQPLPISLPHSSGTSHNTSNSDQTYRNAVRTTRPPRPSRELTTHTPVASSSSSPHHHTRPIRQDWSR
jgi:hypothetical protein